MSIGNQQLPLCQSPTPPIYALELLWLGKLKKARNDYRRWMERVEIHNLVFIDEAGVNLGLTGAVWQGNQ